MMIILKDKHWWRIGLVLCIVLGLLVAIGLTQEEVKNPSTLIEAIAGQPETLDPAFAYDPTSIDIIANVYEPLISPLLPPTSPVSVGEFLSLLYKLQPRLATEVPSQENGLISVAADGRTYVTFPIREGVTFQNGDPLTPEDVAYSFERDFIQDRSGGPIWILLEPILGVDTFDEFVENVAEDLGVKDQFDEDLKNFDKDNPDTYTDTMKHVDVEAFNRMAHHFDVAAHTTTTQGPRVVGTNPSTRGTKKWIFSTGDKIYSSPALGLDGTIYVGSYDGYLYAINPDGTEKWKFYCGDAGIHSSPAIDDSTGIIYVGSSVGKEGSGRYSGYIFAINPDGTEKWRVRTGDWVVSSPAIGPNGTIYIGSYDSYLYAINPDGSIKWKFYAGRENAITSSPTVSSDGTIYFGSKKKFYAIKDLGNRYKVKWSISFRNWVSCSPAIGSDGTIYISSFDRSIYAIKPQLQPDGTLKPVIKWSFSTGDELYSSPAISVDERTVYVGSWDHNLYAIDSETGEMKWKFITSGKIDSSPAIGSDNTIYVGSYDGNLYAINPDASIEGGVLDPIEGTKWMVSAQGLIYSSPLIAPDGTIYVGSNDGNLYAITGGIAPTLAETPSPLYRHDIRHTGNVSTSIHTEYTGCTYVVKPTASIQDAINLNNVNPDKPNVICLLKGGSWQDQVLNITKPVVLRGIGSEKNILINSKISINLSGSGKVVIENIKLQVDNPADIGISFTGSASSQLEVKGLEISGALYGIKANGFKSILIENTRAINNIRHGIFAQNGENIEIKNSEFSGNGTTGITLADGIERGKIEDSAIIENGVSEECSKDNYVCAGVIVGDKIKITFKDVTITKNKRWGIACTLIKCGFSEDSFEGEVILEGRNTIEDNISIGSGATQGGDVCLP